MTTPGDAPSPGPVGDGSGAPGEPVALPEFRPPGPGPALDPEEAVHASPAVVDLSAPVLRVRVTEDGWQFLAGRRSSDEELVAVPRGELYRLVDRRFAALEEWLSPGWGAVRLHPGEPWGIGPLVLQDRPEGASAPPAAAAAPLWRPHRAGDSPQDGPRPEPPPRPVPRPLPGADRAATPGGSREGDAAGVPRGPRRSLWRRFLGL